MAYLTAEVAGVDRRWRPPHLPGAVVAGGRLDPEAEPMIHLRKSGIALLKGLPARRDLNRQNRRSPREDERTPSVTADDADQRLKNLNSSA